MYNMDMELWNLKGKQDSITEALQLSLPEHAAISVIGAGGKTSLIFAWARELAAAGKKVVISTTTHMYSPARMKQEPADMYDGISCISVKDASSGSFSLISSALDGNGIVFIFSPDGSYSDKVTTPPADVLDRLQDQADVMLIEADGSRRMPLKWPGEHEPVIPDYTDITICVCGLSGLGRPVSDVIYRADELPERLRRDVVDFNLIHALVSSQSGGRKGVRGEFRVFMNQIDDDIDRLAAAYRLQQFFAVLGIQSAWGSLKDPDDLKLAVILEAAGDSRRFGSNKLLHVMDDGRPMTASILDAVRGIDAYKKIIVTQYDEVADLADGFTVVRNDRPDLGISRSMQLGIEAAGDADAYMFCVCDQPGLKASTLEKLIEAYKNGTAGIVSLAWQGKMCNPKIFSSRYRDELMSLSGDTGGRQIIAGHESDLLLVEAESVDEVRDIDHL